MKEKYFEDFLILVLYELLILLPEQPWFQMLYKFNQELSVFVIAAYNKSLK